MAGLALGLAALVASGGCTSANSGGSVADAAADGPDASAVESGVDAGPRDLANGESCTASAQCRGACCELHRGNMTVCAQITPFDTTQSCACAEDAECAAITLCGEPGFCQEANVVTSQRFCSRFCR